MTQKVEFQGINFLHNFLHNEMKLVIFQLYKQIIERGEMFKFVSSNNIYNYNNRILGYCCLLFLIITTEY
jgi:hypothetical protein